MNIDSDIKGRVKAFITDSKFEEIFLGSVWALSARIIATAISLLVLIVIARFYGAEMVGVIAVLNSFFLISTIITVLGTNTSILRLIPEYLVKYSPSAAFLLYKKVILIIIVASVIVSLAALFFSGLLAQKVFSKPHFGYYFSIASFFILFNALMRFNTQAIRGLKLMKTFAVFQVLPSTFNLLFLVGATLFYFSYNIPVYAYLASMAFVGLIGWIIVMRTFNKKIDPHDTVVSTKIGDILSVSLPMLMTATMGFVIGQTGVLILGIFKSEAQVGYFSIAVKLATLTSFLLTAINSIAAPKFSELFHSGQIDELFYVAKKSTRLIFFTSTPILLCLVLLGKPILHYCFGKDFVVAYPALLILIVGQFIGATAGSCGNFMNMTGHHIAFRNLILISSIANVALNFVLIPRFGVMGAAITTSICTAYLNISLLIFIKYKYGRTTGFLPFSKELSLLWKQTKT